MSKAAQLLFRDAAIWPDLFEVRSLCYLQLGYFASPGKINTNTSFFKFIFLLASQLAQWQTIHLSMQETQEMWVRSLGREDPLE